MCIISYRLPPRSGFGLAEPGGGSVSTTLAAGPSRRVAYFVWFALLVAIAAACICSNIYIRIIMHSLLLCMNDWGQAAEAYLVLFVVAAVSSVLAMSE